MDDPSSSIQRYASRVFDWALYGVIFVAPLFMGGRGPFGKFVFVCFVALMAVAWMVGSIGRKAFVVRLSGAEWIIAGGAMLLVFQLLPLPESFLLAISPNHRELLPIWFSSPSPDHFQIGTWNTISFAPNATRQSLAVYLSYALFFLLMVQRIRTVVDVQWLLRRLAYGTIVLAVFGLAQFLTSNGKFFWFFEHPFRTTESVVKGPFQNQNHFAHMMALGAGPLLWLLADAIRGQKEKIGTKRSGPRNRRHFSEKNQALAVSFPVLALTFGIGVVALASMLTFSRGGFLAFTAATLVTIGLTYWQRLAQGKTLKVAAGIGVMVAVTLCIYGYEPLARRLSTLRESQSLGELSHGRQALWDAMLSATQHFWLTGTGIGSHPDVYPVYMREYFTVEFTHGESGYLPLLMEGGIAAVSLLACVVLLLASRLLPCLWRVSSNDSSQSVQLAALASPLCGSIVASLVHSTGDFVWYISACMSWTIIVMAVAVRLPETIRLSRGDRAWPLPLRVTMPRTFRSLAEVVSWPNQVSIGSTSRPALFSVCFAVLASCIVTLLPTARGAFSWNEFRRVTRNLDLDQPERTRREIELLRRTVAIDPTNAEARNLLTQALWDNQNTTLSQASATVSVPLKEGRLETAQPLAVQLCLQRPLQGRAYVFSLPIHLSQTFSPPFDALLDQALRVRPHDATIHMLQGKYLISAGKIDQGFKHWRFAFNRDPHIRISLISQLQPLFPAAMLIDRLNPDIAGLWQLYRAYQQNSDPKNVQVIASRLVVLLNKNIAVGEDPHIAARDCFSLQTLYMQMGQNRNALEALQKAVRYEPDNYQYRYTLGSELCREKRYAQASKHLKWCVSRRPGDQGVAQALESCVRHQIAAATDSQAVSHVPR